MVRRRLLLITVVLVGCADAPVQPNPEAFTLNPPDVWSGTSVTIKSAGFAHAPPDAILLDDDSLTFTRIDDSSFRALLPDLPGTHQVRVVSPFVLSPPVPIKLNGFLSANEGPVFMGRAVRGAYPTEVYGSGPFGLRRWNVSSGGTYDYPDSMHVSAQARGVGVGPRPGELVLRSSGPGNWQVWRVEPTVEHLDSTQFFSDRFVDHRGNLYVLPASHQTSFAHCDTACSWSWIQSESPYDVVHASKGARAVVVAPFFSDDRAPVIDVASGQVSYYVDSLGSTSGAVFSDRGDTLFLTGNNASTMEEGPTRLRLIRAEDGTVLKTVLLPLNACGLALDPVRPLLYAAGFGEHGLPTLAVFDQATLEPIAQLAADPYAIGFPCMVLPSPLERRIYVITSWNGFFDNRVHALVARFETPPY